MPLGTSRHLYRAKALDLSQITKVEELQIKVHTTFENLSLP